MARKKKSVKSIEKRDLGTPETRRRVTSDPLLSSDIEPHRLQAALAIRAALEALLDYGRPRCVELLTLIDRGHRELPIHADYVGRTINTSKQEHVDVMLAERDGEDSVSLTTAS